MIDFTVKLDGFEGKKVVNKGKRVLMKSMFKMEELALDNAPFDRGYLKGKISVFPQILADEYTLTSRAPYSAVMEYGSRPFYAPIEPLKGWAGRKLGDPDAAYAVRASIAKKGIKAQPFMRPALYQVESFWMPFYTKQEFG